MKRQTFQLPETIEVRETTLVKPSRTVGERKPRELHNAFTDHVAANWANHKDDDVAVEFACSADDTVINGYRNAIYRGARAVKNENGETGKISVKIQIGNYDDDNTFHKMTTPKADAHWPTLGRDTVVIKFKAIAKSDKPRKPKDDAATSAS